MTPMTADGPLADPVFPRSQLSHDEIIRRLTDLGWGDPGLGFRLLCARNNMCSICLRHYPVCTCLPGRREPDADR